MLLNRRHSWTLTPKAAIALQQELRHDVVVDRPLDLAAIRLVAGVDVSVKEKHAQAAIVVLTFPKFEIVETVVAQAPVTFPYVPGLLTFREGPVLEAAFAKLAHVPDVFIFDGIGYAHPRRIGLACHMGLLLGRPSVGCGKTRLCGEHAPVPARRGAMNRSSTRARPSGWRCAARAAWRRSSSRPATSPTSQAPPGSSCAAHQNIAYRNRSGRRIAPPAASSPWLEALRQTLPCISPRARFGPHGFCAR